MPQLLYQPEGGLAGGEVYQGEGGLEERRARYDFDTKTKIDEGMKLCYDYGTFMQRSNEKRSIRFRPTLFWDVDPKTIDPKKHARYIIERILDFGNDREVRWMWYAYPNVLIRDVVKTSRVIQPQTRALWVLLTKKK